MPRLTRWCHHLTALAALLCGVPLTAQAPGRISGVVRDARGDAVVSARVTVTSTATGAVRSAITGADGRYTVSNVAAGSHSVAVTMFGFRRASRTDVQIAGDATVDFTLEPLSLQAVTVTATLREQELAAVPFSIAAPSAGLLRERGADNIEAIAANVAGFTVQNLGPGQSQVAMRGASAGQIARDQPGVKEQVGAYLDDAPISMSLFTPDLDLFDISRVEVLRGPQGTLFGAGSMAGTVRYITNQPELGVRSTFGEVGGSYIDGGGPGANVKLGANAPFGDKAAGRVAAYFSRMGGYMDAVQPNLSVNENVNSGYRAGVRAALLHAPNENLTITPRLVFQRVDMDGWNRIDTFNILGNPYTTTRPTVTLGERKLFTQMEEPFTDDFIFGDVKVQWDLPTTRPMSFTSITSYSMRDILVVRDATALTASITGGSIGLPASVYILNAPLDDATTANVLTQELRLSGGSERFRWLAGAFVTSNQRDYGQSLLVAGFQTASGIPTVGLRAKQDELFYSDLSYDLQQQAVFGEGTLTRGKLSLTGGLRFYNFKEDRTQIFDGIFGNNNTGTSLVSQPGSAEANGLAPRFIASFRANDKVTLNGQVSKGFRLGGINDPLNTPICTAADLATYSGFNEWKDESAWNYEVGAKSLWMNGRASFNLSAFYMDIRDIQLVVTAGSCSSRLVMNVPKAASQGAEIEFAAAPNPNFDFSLSATTTNSELRSGAEGAGGTPLTIPGIASGNRLPSVPEIQLAAAATWRRTLRPGLQGFLSGNVQHTGSHYTQIDDHAFTKPATVNLNSFAPNTIGGPLTQATFTFDPLLPAYTLANARVGVTKGTWDAAVYVNNLTDERAFLALDRERGTRARVGYLTNQPRTMGVSLSFQR